MPSATPRGRCTLTRFMSKKDQASSPQRHLPDIPRQMRLVSRAVLAPIIATPTFLGSAAGPADAALIPGLGSYLADEGDSATDSDAISSVGDTNYDFSDIAHLSNEEQQQELFWAYEHKRAMAQIHE